MGECHYSQSIIVSDKLKASIWVLIQVFKTHKDLLWSVYFEVSWENICRIFYWKHSQVEFFYNSYKTAYFSNLIKYKFTLWNLKKNIILKFFIIIIIIFYFTILYWFCHTSTCIRHGYTRVPHPEAPSHVPPHTIPLGHLSAPAPSFLYPALNLDWRFVKKKKKQLIVNFFPVLFT